MKTIKKLTGSLLVLGLMYAMLTTIIVPSRTEAATLGRQLEIGMSGSDVTALQTYLAADSAIYPEGLITGYFGPLTRAAVIRFQARFGIPQVGRVGPQTLAAIGDLTNTSRRIGTDRSAPAINGVDVDTTSSSATIKWNTDSPASALVYYDTSALRLTEADANHGITVSGITNLVNANLTNSHSASLTELRPNTSYNYLIYSRDASGNVNITWPHTFQTD